MPIAMMLGGFVLLVIGGEFLVRGAVGVAERLGMSRLLIGLTLVGFGTSAPELVTSVQASLHGSPGVAVGNIVGSNLANILLILGVSALLSPMVVSDTAVQRDGTIVLATALIFTAIGYTAELNRAVGTLFVLGLVSYLVFAYRQERNNGRSQEHTAALEKAEGYEELHGIETPAQLKQETAAQRMGLILAFLGMAIGGLVVIVAGGGLLVEGAIALAREMGISETVIGLSIVAIGTSLPELVTCVVAALRGHSDIALGNIMGSNIYNILGIGGVTALISPTVIPPEIVSFDNFAMLAASFALLVVTKTGYKVTRLEGAALVAAYGAYLWIIWPK